MLNLYQTRSLEVIKKSRVCYEQKYRQFCTDWYEAYSWLVLCASRSKAFCGYCCYGKFKGLLTDKNADLAFIDTRFNNWKKALERFEQHNCSIAHREVSMKVELLKQPSVCVQLNTQLQKEQKKRREMFIVMLPSLKYLVS